MVTMLTCPRRACDHVELLHDWGEPGEDPVCCVEDCSCGKGPTNETGNGPEWTESPGAVVPDCKQTSEVKA